MKAADVESLLRFLADVPWYVCVVVGFLVSMALICVFHRSIERWLSRR